MISLFDRTNQESENLFSAHSYSACMDLDKDAIAEFLSLGYPLGDRTFRKGEPPATLIDVPQLTVHDGSVDDVEDTLKRSIHQACTGKEHVGVLLSGGKDARLVVAMAHDLGLNVTAVTVGDKNNRSEESAASKVASALDVPFMTVRIPETISPSIVSEIGDITGGITSFSAVAPIYLIKDELTTHFDIVLSGNLMTEIMDTCEYRWYDSKNPLDVMKRKHLKGSKVLTPEYAQRVEEHFTERYRNKTLEEIILDTEFKNRSRALWTLTMLGVPIVAPVADKAVISTTFSLPLEKRINGRLVTTILKKHYPALANIRTSKTSLPLYFPWWIHYGTHRVKDRTEYLKKGQRIWAGEPRTNKMGMWDQGYIYKYKIGGYVRDSLENLELDILNHDFIQQVLTTHFSEKQDLSSYIPRLLTLKDWLERNNAT